MNSDIVLQGPTEIVTGPATIARPVLRATALNACALTSIVFSAPATPANGAAVSAFATFPALGNIENVKSMTVSTGTMLIVYRY